MCFGIFLAQRGAGPFGHDGMETIVLGRGQVDGWMDGRTALSYVCVCVSS